MTLQKRTVSMIAGKLPRYAGKALKAGEAFEAAQKDAKVLAAAKLATYDTRDQARQPKVERKPPSAPAPNADAGDLAKLRTDYKDLAGKPAHNFWKADRVRAEIDKLLAADTTDAGGVADDDAPTE